MSTTESLADSDTEYDDELLSEQRMKEYEIDYEDGQNQTEWGLLDTEFDREADYEICVR